MEADYGKTGMQKIITTVGNVVSGSARAKETLEWLSNDIFGKVVQLKKGVTIDRDRTSVNLNENMDSLVPGSKIADMATGWMSMRQRTTMPGNTLPMAMSSGRRMNLPDTSPKNPFGTTIAHGD